MLSPIQLRYPKLFYDLLLTVRVVFNMQFLMVVGSLLATIGLIASPVSGNGTLPPFPVSFA